MHEVFFRDNALPWRTEELLQIHIHHHPPAFLHMTLGSRHRIMCPSARPETEAVAGKRRINQGLQNLQQGVLDQAIRHGRYPQLRQATSGLGNLRPVTTLLQRIPNPRPVDLETLGRGLDRQPIHPRHPTEH